ncbi:SDR family NAD(P)-dependent oxidoreductase [Nannocystis bainbridge]|uniref:SDR family NAD(P)-dependent oxidoreductase n=1 Tax=Nannocystis bainbridge TaxID=2995303 RepID=A0ABT5E361_9BACT|nr:SDR family oxidoreductase [Nannocystis bainbridge]MDC0720310.1 SDR family NAD(P)-dependent oxidoreductase [Nannocystis bainbridge]
MSAAADTVVLTGGSAGIGQAIAARARADGRCVINLSRRPCPVDGVTNLAVDLGDAAAVADAMTRVRDLLGAPGRVHLIHNAAFPIADAVTAFDARACEQAMRVNVVTPAELTAGLLPSMAPGSSVIFIGSTLSEKGVPGRLTYCATKHALVGLLRATVQDLFGAGIHAVCVCPGFVDTPLLDPLRARGPEVIQQVLGMVSYGRFLSPEEVADIVAFALERPSLNGAIIHANLGQREG